MNYRPSRTVSAAAVCIIALIFAGISVVMSEDAAYVNFIGMVIVPIAFLAAILLGVVFSRYVSTQTSSKKTNPTGVVAVFTVLTIASVASFWFLTGGAFSTALLPYYAIPLIFGGLAFAAAKYSKIGAVPPRGVRYLLVGGAFIGGALPGLMLYLILSIVVSERYCQLTSSKCL